MGLIGKEYHHIPGLFSKHGLVRLLPTVRSIFRAMRWDFEDTGIGTFDEFERIVRQVDEIDPRSQTFRYPMNPAEQTHLPHAFTMNVVRVGEAMDELLGYLDGAADLLDDTFQSEAEARNEVQQLMADEGEA